MPHPTAPCVPLVVEAIDDASARHANRSGLPRRAGGVHEHARFVAQLFERFRPGLLRYLSGLLARSPDDAEDLLQETYARLLDAPDLERDTGRARAYLYRVATNLAYDRFRKRREGKLEDLYASAVLDSREAASPEHMVDLAQGLEIVERTLLDLKPRCRQVFLLRASEQLGYSAIGERLGISTRTVEREMKHALKTCQRRLERARK